MSLTFAHGTCESARKVWKETDNQMQWSVTSMQVSIAKRSNLCYTDRRQNHADLLEWNKMTKPEYVNSADSTFISYMYLTFE